MTTTNPTEPVYVEGPRTIIATNNAGDVAVFAAGLRYADRSLVPEICVNQLHADCPITAAEARQIARAMMAAADIVDRMTEGEA